MKKLLILAALVAVPVIAVGCTCPQPASQPACPPVVAPACPPAVQPACPPVASQPVAVKPVAAYSVAAAPVPVGGQITYAQPIQVSGVNGVVQYYNPYLQPALPAVTQ
jgi:hypothetical protein